MTVHTTSNKAQFTGNGSARVWSYTFPCADEDWLKVYVTENGVTTQVLNDYAVDLDAKEVTYPVNGTALTSSQTLTILREVPLEQSLDLVNQGTLAAEAIESEFDEIVQMLQGLDEKLGRCIMAGVAENEPAVDYDDLTEAAQLASTNGAAAGTAAAAAIAAANLANNKADAANTAAGLATTKAQAANAAASAAQAVADAVVDYTTRAETAAQLAEEERIKAYSNALQAHRYFCAVWGVCYPFISWFMCYPLVDGKCSRVFCRRPGIYDGGCSAIFAREPGLRILDGMHSDPLQWIAVNPLVTEFINAIPKIRTWIAEAKAAQHALELTITAANAAAASAAQACRCISQILPEQYAGTISAEDVIVGETSHITVAVNGVTGKGIVRTTMIRGSTIQKNEKVATDGVATLTFSTATAGDYKIAAEYINSDMVTRWRGSTTFTVSPSSGDSDANTYTLTIQYLYADSTLAAQTYTGEYAYGETFSVESPVISGYYTTTPTVTGTMPARDYQTSVIYVSQTTPDPPAPPAPPGVDVGDFDTPLDGGLGGSSGDTIE